MASGTAEVCMQTVGVVPSHPDSDSATTLVSGYGQPEKKPYFCSGTPRCLCHKHLDRNNFIYAILKRHHQILLFKPSEKLAFHPVVLTKMPFGSFLLVLLGVSVSL